MTTSTTAHEDQFRIHPYDRVACLTPDTAVKAVYIPQTGWRNDPLSIWMVWLSLFMGKPETKKDDDERTRAHRRRARHALTNYLLTN